MWMWCAKHHQTEPAWWGRADHEWIGPYETEDEAEAWAHAEAAG